MYTQGGTVNEVCRLLMADDSPQPIGGTRNNASVVATVEWLKTTFVCTDDIATELLRVYGSDDAALRAICDFASGLQPE